MILDPVVADYLEGLYEASDPILAEMERQGAAEGVPIVLRDGGLTLGVLARAAGARRVIECGTAIGVSTLHLARAVGDGGYVVSFDVDPDRQATARGYLERAGVADRVDLRLQPALDGLKGLDGPKLPGIAGIETYRGHSFHTRRWDYEYTGGDPAGAPLDRLADKRVGIIGTGATAVQCIPHLARASAELFVFQRTPSSIDVRNNHDVDPTGSQRWSRAGRRSG